MFTGLANDNVKLPSGVAKEKASALSSPWGADAVEPLATLEIDGNLPLSSVKVTPEIGAATSVPSPSASKSMSTADAVGATEASAAAIVPDKRTEDRRRVVLSKKFRICVVRVEHELCHKPGEVINQSVTPELTAEVYIFENMPSFDAVGL